MHYYSGVLERFKKLLKMPWFYQRRVTTAAVASVAVLSASAARAMLPRSSRPSGLLAWLAAIGGAYLALRLGSYTGMSKRFKHTYLDWFGGDVDDAQTWILGTLGGGSVLLFLQMLGRAFNLEQGQAEDAPSRPHRLRVLR
jgi:hypothetical protein